VGSRGSGLDEVAISTGSEGSSKPWLLQYSIPEQSGLVRTTPLLAVHELNQVLGLVLSRTLEMFTTLPSGFLEGKRVGGFHAECDLA